MRLLWLAAVLLFACSPRPGARDGGSVVPDSGVTDSGVRDAGPGSSCPAGRTLCSGLCVDVRIDKANCGTCGLRCEVDQLCVAGQCRANCLAGLIDCGGTCINPTRDPVHCGRCDNACGPLDVCEAGACARVPGRELCDGVITDTLTDPAHCGACGQLCPVATATCVSGLCCTTAELRCGGACAQIQTDPLNCGRCGAICGSSQVCSTSACRNCPFGQLACGNACTDVSADPTNCGACGTQCSGSQTCTNSTCTCPASLSACAGDCVDRYTNVLHCGACNTPCNGSLCISGACVAACPTGLTLCGDRCVDTLSTAGACGSCAAQCGAGQECDAGACVVCAAVAGADCDHDGFTLGAGGDCCDAPGVCGTRPELINPGAFEVLGNGVDDNCNGLTDNADVLDVSDCDSLLTSNSLSAEDAAKALDICRLTTAGATGPLKTWGLISAEWVRADGRPLTYADGHSIRGNYGTGWSPRRGAKLLVVSSGVASDATQTAPGPNGGPLQLQSADQVSLADLTSCDGGCLFDWFGAANLPVKAANQLPESPLCMSGGATDPEVAHDSVMLLLRLRAPTNARAFTLSGAFFSVEYPEYVCSDFNDQLVAVVDTPRPTWPLPNPPDKNLLTYRDGALRYPVGINVAAATTIFESCERPGTNLDCDDTFVSPRSCSAGLTRLAGTGFEQASPAECAQGGASRWLQVRGNIVPGEEVTLRLAIWDVGDEVLDSTALLDAFRWELNPVTPGTE